MDLPGPPETPERSTGIRGFFRFAKRGQLYGNGDGGCVGSPLRFKNFSVLTVFVEQNFLPYSQKRKIMIGNRQILSFFAFVLLK